MNKISQKVNLNSQLLIASVLPVILLAKGMTIWFFVFEVVFIVALGALYGFYGVKKKSIYFRPCLINITGIILACLVLKHPDYKSIFLVGWLLMFFGALVLFGKEDVKS